MQTLVLSRRQVRAVDELAVRVGRMSGLVLMENAGRGCVDVLHSLGVRGPVAIACGKGNNGGDGFVMARHLDLAGIAVRVVLLSSPSELAGDAAANFALLSFTNVAMLDLSAPGAAMRMGEAVTGAEWIVDALLGTGATGEPREPIAAALTVLNAATGRKLAVDIPSGLDCDSGHAAATTFRAHHTCTLVAPKPGLLVPSAGPFVGTLHVVGIGVPRRIIEMAASQSGGLAK